MSHISHLVYQTQQSIHPPTHQENTEMLLGDAKAMADALLAKVTEQTA